MHKRQGEAERYDLSRPKDHSERQEDRRASPGTLLACQIERLAGEEETYLDGKRRAVALRDHGFRLGGKFRPSDATIRDETFAAAA